MFATTNNQNLVPPFDIYLRERKNFSCYSGDSNVAYNYTCKEGFDNPFFHPDKPFVILSVADGTLTGGFKRFLRTRRYTDAVNNIDSALGLSSINIDITQLIDRWDWALHSFPPSLEDQEQMYISNNEAFLRVNTKDKVVYTVKRSGDWYIFKSFIPGIWSTCEHAEKNRKVENSEAKLLLKECSQWCVKQLPNLDLFSNIHPNITTMEEVIQMDPSFRYCEQDGIRYSTHTFADTKGTRISIRYKKDEDGIFRVINFTRVWEGFNVLPYLLPIDRQLIDPNYTPSEEPEELEEVGGTKDSCCNIM